MEDGKRSWEFAAIPLTLVLLGILFVVLWAASAGSGAFLVLGVMALVVLLVGTLIYMARAHHPAAPASPTLPQGAAAKVGDGVHRILVIADEACAASDLGPAIARHGGQQERRAFVIAPPLGSRTARWTGDEHAYVEAGEHLQATLEALSNLGVEADGHIGSHDPLQAVEDGLREFPADEIVFALPAGGGNWLEDGVVESARARYPLPVTELAVCRATS